MRTQQILVLTLALAFATQSQALAQTPPDATPTAVQNAAPAANTPATPGATDNTATPTTTNTGTPAATTANQGTAETTTTKSLYCPAIIKLKKIDMFWGAPGGWRSYSESFVNSIASFSGAQWIGINVGKMVCVYKGKETFEFPVVLQNDTLTPTPEGGKWVKKATTAADASGYINCLSNDVLDCPFKFEEQKTDMKNVYKNLNFFKDKPDYLKNDNPSAPPAPTQPAPPQ